MTIRTTFDRLLDSVIIFYIAILGFLLKLDPTIVEYFSGELGLVFLAGTKLSRMFDIDSKVTGRLDLIEHELKNIKLRISEKENEH